MLTEALIRDGARVVVLYAMVFIVAISYQVVAKTRAIREGQKAEKENRDAKFNRYASSDSMLIGADRAVGNFLEWAPTFLTMFWLALYYGEEKAVLPGYLYVALRFLYVVLVSQGGITRYGPRKTILFSTIPMYGVLIYFLYLVVPAIL